jgi:Uma2 family endonuclease
MSADHGESTPDVSLWLGLYRRRTPGVRQADGATLILGEFGEPQPDALLRIEPERGGSCSVNEENYLTGPPELIVEVARSSRSFDLGGKRDDYERSGVREYIVVALDPDEIHWHVRRGERLERILPDPDGLYRSAAFPGLWLDPAALLSGDLEGSIATLDRGLATPEHAAFVARLADAAARHTNGA